MRRPPLNELQNSLEIIFGNLDGSERPEFGDPMGFSLELDSHLDKLGDLKMPDSSPVVTENFRELEAITSRFFIGTARREVHARQVDSELLFLDDYWQQPGNTSDARVSLNAALGEAVSLMRREMQIADLNFFLISDLIPEVVAERLKQVGIWEFEVLQKFRVDEWKRYWPEINGKRFAVLKGRLEQELKQRNDYQSPLKVWSDARDRLFAERYLVRRGLTVCGSYNIRKIAFNQELGKLSADDYICPLSGGQWYSFGGLDGTVTTDKTNHQTVLQPSDESAELLGIREELNDAKTEISRLQDTLVDPREFNTLNTRLELVTEKFDQLRETAVTLEEFQSVKNELEHATRNVQASNKRVLELEKELRTSEPEASKQDVGASNSTPSVASQNSPDLEFGFHTQQIVGKRLTFVLTVVNNSSCDATQVRVKISVMKGRRIIGAVNEMVRHLPPSEKHQWDAVTHLDIPDYDGFELDNDYTRFTLSNENEEVIPNATFGWAGSVLHISSAINAQEMSAGSA